MKKSIVHAFPKKPEWFRLEDPSKLTNSFEFGPAWLVQLPMFLYGLMLSIRFRNPVFYEAVNPGMQNGGLFDYSKFDSFKYFRSVNIPKTLIVNCPKRLRGILDSVEEAGIAYPFIVKPDFGERGREVEVIYDLSELAGYFSKKVSGNYLIQENIAGGLELGVFFQRDPISGAANVSSMTLKIPLQVIGDGENSIIRLIKNHPRAKRYMDEVDQKLDMDFVPAKGELVKLSQKGNHSKGATFLDCSDYINAALIRTFDRICCQFEGFYYGRLDVKVERWEDLWDDKQIKIIEVNGCNSEPIHIYSPGMTYGRGISSIKQHFALMGDIAGYNLKHIDHEKDVKKSWSNYLQFRKSRRKSI
jgi:hypothetical protein